MPKRKRNKRYEEDFDHLMHKVRKLERKLRNYSESVSSHSGSIREDFPLQETESPLLRPDDWFPEFPDEPAHDSLNHDVGQLDTIESQGDPIGNRHCPIEETRDSVEDQQEPIEAQLSAQVTPADTRLQPACSNTSVQPAAAILREESKVDNQISGEGIIDLDDDILQILGDDPSSAVKYGKEIRPEIAARFIHASTEGISKENRKDLIAKYLIPANCVCIGAPKLNAEIKAALSETFAKRDKGIESKQKEMASAISCLGEIITSQLCSKQKNNELLQKLIDLSRILCDLQYADSVTRRNFILFTLKKDLKDHLANTKVDTYLFGENLTETLKTAKAVIKSGVELKASAPKQATPQHKKLKSAVSRPLNRRGPASRRPPPGPPPAAAPAPAPRSRAPTRRAPPSPAPAPPPPAPYYRPSYAHQPQPPYPYQQRRY